MWPKIIDLVIAWLKSKPRSDLTAQVLALRDAMRDCHATYLCFATAKDQRDQAMINQRYKDWRAAFGVLDNTVASVNEVLHIFGKEAYDEVNRYMLSESMPCAEDGNAVSAAIITLLNERPDNPQATTGKSEFSDALDKLDRFISVTFKPEEIVAAKRAIL